MQRIGIDASDSMSQRRNMTDTVANSASRSHFQSALKLRDRLDPMVSAGRIITKQSTRFVAPMQATLIRDKAETTPKQSNESRKFRQEKPTFIASKEQNTLADTIKPIGMSSLIPHPMNKPVPQSVIVQKTVKISCNEEAKRKNVNTADNSILKKSKRCRDGEDAVLVESREEFPKNRLITEVNVVGINTTCGHTISSDDESLSLGTPDDIDDDDLLFEE